jgi:ketosteroid isomerase-like protein
VTGHKLEIIDAGREDKVVFGTAKWSATSKDEDGKPTPLSGRCTYSSAKRMAH